MALPTRLVTICAKRVGSPITAVGRSAGQSMRSARPLFCTCGSSTETDCSAVLRRSKGTDSVSSCPASIFEKSRMSLRICSSESAERRITSTERRWAFARLPFSSSSVMPMTPFIGVRSSWLMVARKADFARLAASAASFEALSSRLLFSS